MSKVLKRLRQAQADDKVDVNHQEITFDYRSLGVRFAATPEGLRTALAKACGSDLGAYVVEKQRQLQDLGYEAGRFQMDTTFSVAPNELVDVFLGLKPVTVSSLQTYDARFGVSGDVFDNAPLLLRTLERAEALTALAGADRPALTFAEIVDAVPDIEAASRLLLDKPPSWAFNIPMSLPAQSLPELDILLVNRLSWGDQTLAYAAVTKIRRRDDSDIWEIDSVEPRDIRPVPEDGFSEYVQARSAEYDMPNIISRSEDF